MRSFLESIVIQLQPEDLDGLRYILRDKFIDKFHSNFAASTECFEYLIMKKFPVLAGLAT